MKKKIIVAEVMTLSFENSRDESILNCFRGNKQFRFNDSEKVNFSEKKKTSMLFQFADNYTINLKASPIKVVLKIDFLSPKHFFSSSRVL